MGVWAFGCELCVWMSDAMGSRNMFSPVFFRLDLPAVKVSREVFSRKSSLSTAV